MNTLANQLREALQAFAALHKPPVLIGGLALAAHNVVRATRDIDFLVDTADAGRVDTLLKGLGYTCIHRSEDAANYLRGEEGLDLLFAHRPEARRLMDEATPRELSFGRLHVISAEGLIAFKLQTTVNDLGSGRDWDEIRGLLRNNRGQLDIEQLRHYFAIFDKQGLLEELLDETGAGQ